MLNTLRILFYTQYIHYIKYITFNISHFIFHYLHYFTLHTLREMLHYIHYIKCITYIIVRIQGEHKVLVQILTLISLDVHIRETHCKRHIKA
jgi:hypothetical protein